MIIPNHQPVLCLNCFSLWAYCPDDASSKHLTAAQPGATVPAGQVVAVQLAWPSGKPWEILSKRRKSGENPCKIYRKPMGNLWETHGKSVSVALPAFQHTKAMLKKIISGNAGSHWGTAELQPCHMQKAVSLGTSCRGSWLWSRTHMPEINVNDALGISQL